MDSSIFYSHCLIRGKEYEFCIDHNEKATLVSIAVVKELGLPSSWHPHPYYIYFNGRPVYVTLQAWVPIDLNGYKSDMLCDVFAMSGESIVFGRAWLREYEVMYDLSRTQYSFYGMGKKYVLDSSHVLAKQKRELERVERWKKLEAKWKAEDELFLKKYGITPEEVLQGKAPKFNHVDCVVPTPPIDVVHVDNIQFEANTVAVQFVDVLDEHVESIVAFEELTCPTMEEVVPKAAAVVDIHVVHDVDSHDIHFMEVDTIEEEFKSEESTHMVEMENSHRSDFVDVHVEEEQSDFLSLSACSSPISSTLQVLHDPALESDTGLLDTPHATPIFHTDVLALVDMAGQPKDIQAVHVYYDPFLVHFHPIDYVLADFFEVLVPWCTRILNAMFSSTCFLVVRHYEGLFAYVRPRLLFDPGGFEDESFRTGRE